MDVIDWGMSAAVAREILLKDGVPADKVEEYVEGAMKLLGKQYP